LNKRKKRIAIFASGSGSNAERFFEYFKNSSIAEAGLLCCNNPDAYVLERARKHKVKSCLFTNQQIREAAPVLEVLKEEAIEFIVLAGFLRLVPSALVEAYPDRIVNIHPALLPRWGGKGMYGMRVHEAVKQAGEVETGITIHFVNSRYDEGNIIFQASCPVVEEDSPASIAEKIHLLEHRHYPKVVEDILRKMPEKYEN
jgi:phosphoribosylglycinamide formyltransferase-1